jgi:Resolvase, N terminal domain
LDADPLAQGVKIARRNTANGRDQRPATNQILKDAVRCRFDVCMCWFIDRLGRGVLHVACAMAELDAAGVALCSDQQAIDGTASFGRYRNGAVDCLVEHPGPEQAIEASCHLIAEGYDVCGIETEALAHSIGRDMIARTYGVWVRDKLCLQPMMRPRNPCFGHRWRSTAT